MVFMVYLVRNFVTIESIWYKMKRKKNDLVPFEESKRVIYLERQGQRKVQMTAGSVVFGVLGVLCIFYCIAIGFAGFGTKFFLIWGAMGVASLLISAALENRSRLLYYSGSSMEIKRAQRGASQTIGQSSGVSE